MGHNANLFFFEKKSGKNYIIYKSYRYGNIPAQKKSIAAFTKACLALHYVSLNAGTCNITRDIFPSYLLFKTFHVLLDMWYNVCHDCHIDTCQLDVYVYICFHMTETTFCLANMWLDCTIYFTTCSTCHMVCDIFLSLLIQQSHLSRGFCHFSHKISKLPSLFTQNWLIVICLVSFLTYELCHIVSLAIQIVYIVNDLRQLLCTFLVSFIYSWSILCWKDEDKWLYLHVDIAIESNIKESYRSKTSVRHPK